MECQCAGCYPQREARRKHRELMDKINKTNEAISKASAEDDSESKTKKLDSLKKMLKEYRESLFK